MYNITWKDREKAYDKSISDVDDFFVDLMGGVYDEINGVKLKYRSGQKEFAASIMKAIKDKDILLVEAGVGIGKSIGYLIPIFYTVNNVQKFSKIVISTSTIALSEQLLEDVEKVSKLLNIPLRAEVSKGINNYACLKNLHLAIDRSKSEEDRESQEKLEEIKKYIYSTVDKSKLPKLSNALWKRIQVKGGCNTCDLKSVCEFYKMQMNAGKSDIIITNHTQLANMLRDKNNKVVDHSDCIVIDEAHKLEEEMRLSRNTSVNIRLVIAKLSEIRDKLEREENYDTYYELKNYSKIAGQTVNALIEFIKSLRTNALAIYKSSYFIKADAKDLDKLSIDLSNDSVRECLNDLVKKIMPFTSVFNKDLPIPGINRDIKYVKDFISLLLDMQKNKESKNVYWVKFIDGRDIEIVFTPKSMDEFYNRLYDKKKPIIMTSGTLMTDGTYDDVKSSFGLSNRDTKECESIKSPFDYEHNTLVYYDTTLPNPNILNRGEYINKLAIAIKNSILATEGKALILFTSKRDMRDVYSLISNMGLDYKLILQGNDVNKCKEEFEKDVNSCLFATGAFWEGIDIKGRTLSNLIIARLPFPVQDPIVEYKKGNLSKREAFKLDKDEMLMKLAQGCGRLIRSVDDKGVVCMLDSRVPKYLNSIKNTLPFTNYTSDFNTMSTFAEENIVNGKTLRLI